MAAPSAGSPREEHSEGAMGNEPWALDDACLNAFWNLDGGPEAVVSLDVLQGNWESAPLAAGCGTALNPTCPSRAEIAGTGCSPCEERPSAHAISAAQQGESGNPREASASCAELPEGTATLAGIASSSRAPWQAAEARATRSFSSTPAMPQSNPSGFSTLAEPVKSRQDAFNPARMQGSGAEDAEDALLPPQVIGFVPQSHFVSILDHLHDRGVTLGIDRLLPSPSASAAQALAPLPDVDPGTGFKRGSPREAHTQEMGLGADSPMAANGVVSATAPSGAPRYGGPLVPRRGTGNDTEDDVYTVAGLPAAVARKVFGFDLDAEDLRSSGIWQSTSGPDEQGLPCAQLQASPGAESSGEGCSAMEMLWESTLLRGIPTKDNQSMGKVAAVPGPLAMPRLSWAGGTVPLNEKLASALTLIEVQGQPAPAASRTRLLAGLPSCSSARDTHSVVMAAASEGNGKAVQSLMVHELGRSIANKRLNLGVDGRLNRPQLRIQGAALNSGPSFAAGDADASALALVGARNASNSGNASSAWESPLVPRSVAMPRMNELERDFFLKRLIELAVVLERKDMVRFKELYSRLHLHAKLRGRASERTIFHMLRSFICRKDGTGADFHNKRTRTSVQEMDNARKWYFTAHPTFIFLYFASAGPALLRLKGHRCIHIVTIGPVMQWPVLLRRLKQDPVDGVQLRRVRLTIINTWSLVCPQRIDLSTMRSLGLVGNTISEAAASLGLEFGLRIVDVTDDSLDWIEAIDRREDEALAVCTASELSFLHEDTQFAGGLRRRLFQALKDMRVDVFTIAENEVPGGSSPFFSQRLVGCFQFLWALLHSHDSLGIGNHRHARFVEHIIAELRLVNALSTEGIERRWRPMSCPQWHQCLLQWGFTPLNVEASALALMKGIIKSYPACFQVDSEGPWLKLMWEGTAMYSASAWTL